MKRFFITVSIVLCSLASASAQGQKTGTIKGKIETEKSRPIAGAQVRVMSSRTRDVKEATTDQAGEYSLEVAPDDYTISFDAEGFQGGTLVQMHQVEEGKVTSVKTIRLQKASRSSLIRGAVFDSSGSSLAGARVKLVRVPTADEAKDKKKVDSLTRDYTTNSRGEFAFRLPAVRARYQVTAILTGYKAETKTVDVEEGEAMPLAFSLEPLRK
jgi:hypothetical protein